MDDDDVYIEPEESEQDFVISTEPVVVTDYSGHARNALQSAETAASIAPDGVLTCEHLLLSLADDGNCAAAQVMAQCGFTGASIAQTIAFIGGTAATHEPAKAAIHSPRVERVLTTASVEAGNRNAAQIDTLHLLFGLIREQQGIAVAALETPGVRNEMIGAALSSAMRNGMTDPS